MLARTMRQKILREEDQAVAQEEANRLQVHRRAGHELPRLLRVEEAELEALKLRVHALAQVELDRDRNLPGDDPPHDRQPQTKDAGAEDRQRERPQLVLVDVRARRSRPPPCRSGAGSGPLRPSRARRSRAKPGPLAGRGEGSRRVARVKPSTLTIRSEVMAPAGSLGAIMGPVSGSQAHAPACATAAYTSG